MNTVILGATKGMGRALARQLAARGDRLHLLGRDPAELEVCVRDLVARGPLSAAPTWSVCDLERSETFPTALREARAALGKIELVIVTAGMFATQEQAESDLARTARMLNIDFTQTVVFCEHVRPFLLEGGSGTLCVFSSVAGERGRRPVVLYGAAKAGLSAYLEGLDHRFRGQGLRTVCVKPGFIRTSMTSGLPEPPFAADPQDVVARVLSAIDRGAPVVYVPAIWSVVMLVIRHLPRAVMRKVSF